MQLALIFHHPGSKRAWSLPYPYPEEPEGGRVSSSTTVSASRSEKSNLPPAAAMSSSTSSPVTATGKVYRKQTRYPLFYLVLIMMKKKSGPPSAVRLKISMNMPQIKIGKPDQAGH